MFFEKSRKILLCLLLNVVGLVQEKNESLVSKVRHKRLIGGEKVHPGDGKYIGSLQRKTDRHHLCSVCLITYKIMLTSCSCVQYGTPSKAGFPHNSPSEYIVVAGDRYYTNKLPDHTREVLRFEAGDSCFAEETTQIWQFGVGYIELVKEFGKGEQLLTIVDFPGNQLEYESGFKKYYEDGNYAQGGKEYCFVFGWGAQRYTEKDGDFEVSDFAEYLTKRAVQFLSLEQCQKRLCDTNLCDFKVTSSGAVCLGTPDNTYGPLCHGDSGTPLVCQHRIWAIGEMTPDCGTKLKFSIFYKLNIAKILAFQSSASNLSHFLLLYLSIVQITFNIFKLSLS